MLEVHTPMYEPPELDATVVDDDLDWVMTELDMRGAILVCRDGVGRILVDPSLTNKQRIAAVNALHSHFARVATKPQALAVWRAPEPDDAD